jgi:hypothetical protein
VKVSTPLVLIGLVGTLFIVQAFSANQKSTVSDNLLDARKVTLSLKHTTISDALAKALWTTETPGGIAVFYYCEGIPRHSFQLSNTPLRDILDEVIVAKPDYFWEFKNGVVNLLPRYHLPLFLGTIIPKFETNDIETPNEALAQLLALPEVQNQVRAELGIRAITGGFYAYGGNGVKPTREKFSVAVSNVTVREALNAIARADGSAVWVLLKNGCNNGGRSTFSLNFISRRGKW